MRRTYAQLLSLLNKRQRRNFVLLIIMILIMGLMDMAGVASILPFLAVLGNPDMIENRAVLSAVYEGLGFETSYAFLQFLGITVFILVMISIAIKAFTFYLVTRFARSLATSLGIRLLRQYLARPFEWFLSQHSADLGKSVLSEVNQVVSGSFGPAVRVIANSIVLIFLIGLLLVLEPWGAVVMLLLLGACFGVIYQQLRGHLLEIGRDRKQALSERYKIASEAMGGIKEVKILGLESAYVRRFFDPSVRLARHQASVQLLGEMPRYVLEALAFGGILSFVLYLLWSRDGELDAVLPVMGAFAFAGLKLMPTIQALFKDIAQIRFNSTALDALHTDLASPLLVPPDRRGTDFRPMQLRHSLRLDHVSYTYPGAARPSLNDLTLTIPAGTSVGFVGPTGAGKTTAIDVILGLLEPSTGALYVDDVPITDANRHLWQAGIGYVPQSIFLADDTVAANIAFGESEDQIDRDAVRRAAELAHLDGVVDALPQGYDTMIGERGVRFSGGQRQRIGIARALYHDPDIVVFDEATSALDTATERTVMEAIRTLHGQKTILLIAHRLSTVLHCDTIFVLENGRLAGAGDYATLSQDNDAFANLVAASD